MAQKQATEVYLKSGEKVIVSIERGIAARKAMAAGSGVWVIPEQNNRTIDVKMLGDVKDVWIEDIQIQLGEQLKARRIQATGTRVKATATSPGYIKFLLAERKFKRKFGGKLRPLTEEQKIIIDEIEEREAYNKAQDENNNTRTNTSAEKQ